MHGISTIGQPLTGIDHLRQSIRDILTTCKGARAMCRAIE
jgi:phage baseplate assembly protein W